MKDIKKIQEDIEKAQEINESPLTKELRRLGESTILNNHSAIAEIAKNIIPNYSMPELRAPKFKTPKPEDFKIKSFEEVNEYNSAKVLLERLDNYYSNWSAQIDPDCQVAIYALLPNGAAISVKTLTQEGFNGIAIEGLLNNSECLLLTHQASLQFLCVAEKITEEAPRQNIGFVYQ
jgi:hypothetical protein